jgi:hypothetical protein
MNDEEVAGWDLEPELVPGFPSRGSALGTGNAVAIPEVEAETQGEVEPGFRRPALGTGNAIGIPEVEAGTQIEAEVEEEVAAACERLLTVFLDGVLLVIASQAEEGEVVLIGRQAERTAAMKAQLLLLLPLMPHPPVVYRRAALRSRVRSELAVARWTCVSGE